MTRLAKADPPSISDAKAHLAVGSDTGVRDELLQKLREYIATLKTADEAKEMLKACRKTSKEQWEQITASAAHVGDLADEG